MERQWKGSEKAVEGQGKAAAASAASGGGATCLAAHRTKTTSPWAIRLTAVSITGCGAPFVSSQLQQGLSTGTAAVRRVTRQALPGAELDDQRRAAVAVARAVDADRPTAAWPSARLLSFCCTSLYL